MIGPEDVLAILFWRDKDMSVETSVRPDGMITVPLLNDIKAAGLTPEQLREAIEKAAAEYVEDPSVTVAVKQINSRRVFVTGNVAKPGPYPLISATTVLQLISMAGGLTEYADEKGISVMRVGWHADQELQVQLQGRHPRKEARAEHRVEARRHRGGAVTARIRRGFRSARGLSTAVTTRSMHRTSLGIASAIAVLVTAVGTSALAQQAQPLSPRPYRGLFGGQRAAPGEASTSLNLTLSAQGGYDDNVTGGGGFGGGGLTPQDPRFTESGYTGVGAATLEFARGDANQGIDARVTSAVTGYSVSGADLSQSYQGDFGARKKLGRSSTVNAGVNAGYQNYFSIGSFQGVAPPNGIRHRRFEQPRLRHLRSTLCHPRRRRRHRPRVGAHALVGSGSQRAATGVPRR